MQNQQTPQVLAQPFCAQGDKNTIPNSATGSNLASLQEGFPEITGLPVSQGGIPPERQDFNGIMNLGSQFDFAFQNGWLPTFSQDVSDAIGGYPQGAVLWYQSSEGLQILQSAIPNNTNNFITTPSVIGTSWTIVGVTQAQLDSKLSLTGGTMTGRLSMGVNDILFQNPGGGSLLQIATDGNNWDIRGDSTWIRFLPSTFGLLVRNNLLEDGPFFEVLDTSKVNDYITATYTDEEGNWYRKWSSGWLEQGGVFAAGSGDTTQTLTFLQPFADTSYTVSYCGCSSNSNVSSVSWQNLVFYPASNTTATYRQITYERKWIAFGKGA